MNSPSAPSIPVPSARPPPSHRRFVSPAVESHIDAVCARLHNTNLETLFRNSFPNTLDTTVDFCGIDPADGLLDTFLVTGDIPALWLRDSANQVAPYLPLLASGAEDSESLRTLVLGLVYRQAKCVAAFPYANAFKRDGGQKGMWDGDAVTPDVPQGSVVWEAKWEVDSLAAFFKLSNAYHRHKRSSPFIDPAHPIWLAAVERALAVLREQQRGSMEEAELAQPAYRFARLTDRATDTLAMDGGGWPAARCGLVKSAFRPSDDASLLPFPIPANAMLCVELRHLVELLNGVLATWNGETARDYYTQLANAAKEATDLAEEVFEALAKWGVVKEEGEDMFAYEVDGFGNSYFMDDANIPSLLSLPYLGFCSRSDPTYVTTRQRVLSPRNPYFFRGSAGEGVGGPHVGMGWIWPMSIAVRSLTSENADEVRECLHAIVRTQAGTGLVHEAFWKDDPNRFTRSWFAWGCSLVGEMIVDALERFPALFEEGRT
ncbi:glycoside hydrolase family 125 protein [Gonapodya prolifera JEL478]|uniref:Glycoside hydrolase family 125 protein n=1 Tax=Gonapodya prolifera (strain JEL478) TaxID=1344416 RepID=A0A139A8H6_GONPJ|nr:glycoside hydrolase family 125 protein [Gonapodya prolifera JEL478]|eukprot:KXS13102.1 glycoside hydrolase family 125 protein [Gonapodya prolifera JEL478]